ncbi:hypothetical protein V12B01_12975 [Vibrio splendidus 12B01]|nr:hypothetical protein V12B01_12975 [Vibrio splendidus 12B01]
MCGRLAEAWCRKKKWPLTWKNRRFSPKAFIS